MKTLFSLGAFCLSLLTVYADTFNLGGDLSISEDEGLVTVTITRTGSGPLGAESIQLSTSNGSALAGSDFVALNEVNVDFPAEVESASFQLEITDDSLSECEESFFVSISSPGSGNVVSGGNLEVTIELNDFQTLAFDDGSSDVPSSGASFYESGLLAEEQVTCFRVAPGNVEVGFYCLVMNLRPTKNGSLE